MNSNRLKQRLVGAAVLVGLGVIFIPMLLSGPDPLDELVVRDSVPERPQDRRREVVSLEEPPERPQTPEVVVTPVDEHVAESEPENDSDLPPPRLGTRGRPAQSEGGENERVPASEEQASDESKPAEPEQATPEETPEPELAVESEATHAWSVQVGSFSERSNAEALGKRLQQDDFAAYVERAQRGEDIIYRVRVGPVMARDEADELRHTIHEQAGVRGMVMRHGLE